jgi:uncharacterized protein YndB with AHSA1/START domain
MSHQVEHSFEVAVPPSRAWQAFADGGERSKWEAVEYEIEARAGGRLRWALPGLECEGRVVEAEPEHLLRHTEGSGPHSQTEVRVELQPSKGGTRVHIRHSGFGDDAEAERTVRSVTLGWAQAIADLILYLEQGVVADRFVRRMCHAGLQVREQPAGLAVEAVEDGGFAGRAGLQPGDILLAAAGVPIYTRPELWVLMRQHTPGEKLGVEFARAGERLSASAVL